MDSQELFERTKEVAGFTATKSFIIETREMSDTWVDGQMRLFLDGVRDNRIAYATFILINGKK